MKTPSHLQDCQCPEGNSKRTRQTKQIHWSFGHWQICKSKATRDGSLTHLADWFTFTYFQPTFEKYLHYLLFAFYREMQYQHHIVPNPIQLNTRWLLNGSWNIRNLMHGGKHCIRWLSGLKHCFLCITNASFTMSRIDGLTWSVLFTETNEGDRSCEE